MFFPRARESTIQYYTYFKQCFQVIRHELSQKALTSRQRCANISKHRHGEMSERFKELVLKTSDSKEPWVRIPLSPPYSPVSIGLEKYPRGRRGSPAKGVVRLKRSEGSNPSFSAMRRSFCCGSFLGYMPPPGGRMFGIRQHIVRSLKMCGGCFFCGGMLDCSKIRFSI